MGLFLLCWNEWVRKLPRRNSVLLPGRLQQHIDVVTVKTTKFVHYPQTFKMPWNIVDPNQLTHEVS
jgi:hypothetical protein